MDSVLNNALNLRQKLKTELHDIENFIRIYQRLRATESPQQSLELESSEPEHRLDNNTTDKLIAETEPQGAAATDSASASRRGFTKEMLKPHLREVLLDAGAPLTRTQLLRALDAKRIPVGGSNRPKNMGTIMWRLSDDFISLEGFGYWPKDTPYPPASYDPKRLSETSEAEPTQAPRETQ